MMQQLTEIAYAKVNLALHVRARRDDGFHELESLFVFAEHGDLLTAEAAEGDRLSLTVGGPCGAGLEAGPDNLVMRAAKALRQRLGMKRGAALHLDKRVPVASGIGGGSADAAAALRLLLRLWDVLIEPSELEALALELGSDVPACLASVSQLVRGRGERLARHALSDVEGCPMLLVNPRVGISTAEVFAGWDGIDRGALAADDLRTLIDAGRNDLEAPALRIAPVIAEVLGALRQSDARLARMSGSGATCFGLYEDEAARTEAAEKLRRAYPGWWMMETRIRAQ